jgi:hypothetical protein
MRIIVVFKSLAIQMQFVDHEYNVVEMICWYFRVYKEYTWHSMFQMLRTPRPYQKSRRLILF